MLSAGTRDQLYLVARLALARYLGKSQVAVPLILDDPFVLADDERFAAGMKLVAKVFAADRQVLYLTCHAARQRWLQLAEPELAGLTKTIRFEPA